jgi:hypothetical protein
MRKAEIDGLEWYMIRFDRNLIQLRETHFLHLKTEDSAGEITVDSEILLELQSLVTGIKSGFVVDSKVTWHNGHRTLSRVRQPRPDSARSYYRCGPVFERLNAWLRGKGISAKKPLHELRKEVGALVATEHGIYAAAAFLRHSDITTTARHYAEHKARISVGIGRMLDTQIRAEDPKSAAG